MLTDELEAPAELTAAELRRRYETELARVAASVGPERVREATNADAAAAIEAGAAGDRTLAEVAAVLALDAGAPDAETLLATVRDHLLLAMTSAMVNVDVVAADLDADLEPKEVQAKIEGRLPMTLDEYARLHRYLASAAR